MSVRIARASVAERRDLLCRDIRFGLIPSKDMRRTSWNALRRLDRDRARAISDADETQRGVRIRSAKEYDLLR